MTVSQHFPAQLPSAVAIGQSLVTAQWTAGGWRLQARLGDRVLPPPGGEPSSTQHTLATTGAHVKHTNRPILRSPFQALPHCACGSGFSPVCCPYSTHEFKHPPPSTMSEA